MSIAYSADGALVVGRAVSFGGAADALRAKLIPAVRAARRVLPIRSTRGSGSSWDV